MRRPSVASHLSGAFSFWSYVKNKWFKHYNSACEGQLLGDLITQKEYDAALLVFIIMELISRYETDEQRGFASVPIDRIARIANMKPTRIDRLLARISLVSRSDLKCETDEKQPRNRTFLMRNWLKLQETRGGKRQAKPEQNIDRSKKLEVRSKNKEKKYIKKEIVANAPETVFNLDELYQLYPLKKGKSLGMEKLKRVIRSQKDFDDFKTAINKYTQDIKSKGTEPRYIKQFSTFVGSEKIQPWRDWLDDGAGEATVKSGVDWDKMEWS